MSSVLVSVLQFTIVLIFNNLFVVYQPVPSYIKRIWAVFLGPCNSVSTRLAQFTVNQSRFQGELLKEKKCCDRRSGYCFSCFSIAQLKFCFYSVEPSPSWISVLSGQKPPFVVLACLSVRNEKRLARILRNFISLPTSVWEKENAAFQAPLQGHTW